MKNKMQNLTLTALMAAVLCVMGPFTVPVGVVPVSLTNMFIYFVVLIFGKKMAVRSVALYLLMGFVGLPVFSGFSGGAGKILGPTGGYLLGYLILSHVSGWLMETGFRFKNKENRKKSEKRKRLSGLNSYKNYERQVEILSLMAGTVCLYLFGTLWLMYQSKLDFKSALWIGVVPFLAFDIIKIFAAVMLKERVKKGKSF